MMMPCDGFEDGQRQSPSAEQARGEFGMRRAEYLRLRFALRQLLGFVELLDGVAHRWDVRGKDEFAHVVNKSGGERSFSELGILGFRHRDRARQGADLKAVIPDGFRHEARTADAVKLCEHAREQDQRSCAFRTEEHHGIGWFADLTTEREERGVDHLQDFRGHHRVLSDQLRHDINRAVRGREFFGDLRVELWHRGQFLAQREKLFDARIGHPFLNAGDAADVGGEIRGVCGLRNRIRSRSTPAGDFAPVSRVA